TMTPHSNTRGVSGIRARCLMPLATTDPKVPRSRWHSNVSVMMKGSRRSMAFPGAATAHGASGKAIDRRDPFIMTDTFECHLDLGTFGSVVARGIKHLALIPDTPRVFECGVIV